MRGGVGSGSESTRGVAAEPSRQKRRRLRIRMETMDARDDVCVQEAGGAEGEKQAGGSQRS